MCYEPDENQLAKLERCPYVGQKHEIVPEVARLLL